MGISSIYRSALRWAIAVCIIAGISACDDKDPEEPDIMPFSQKYLNEKSVSSDNDNILFVFPDQDSDDFDAKTILEAGRFSGGNALPIAALQLKIDTDAIYAMSVSMTPFYISAAGAEIRIRHIPETPENKGIEVSYINSGLGQMVGPEISKEDMSNYSLREEDGDIYLKFPENKTDDFVMLSLSITSHQKFYAVGQPEPVNSGNLVCFLQMPWTDDESIWENIPEIEF